MSKAGVAPGRPAPSGACPAPGAKPAMRLRVPPQGSGQKAIDASPVRIERMVQAVFNKEHVVKQWRDVSKVVTGNRYMRLQGETRPRYANPVEELQTARADCEKHVQDILHLIDYALTTEAYEDVACPDCEPWTLPDAPLEFIRAVPDAKRPPATRSMCSTCKGRGVMRSKRTDKQSRAAFKRISYFKDVLETVMLCAKVRYGTPEEANDAYLKLEKQHLHLFKFGNEKQTFMEEDDAMQGVRQGIVDAAMRFDPTRKECAHFGTVAYNWSYRNSRARSQGEKRAGVYAPSIESLGKEEEDGASPCSMVAESDGAFGTFNAVTSNRPTLVLDLQEKILELPEEQRNVVLCVMDGKNMAATARELGIKKAAARRLRDVAFTSLRDSLSGYVDVICD